MAGVITASEPSWTAPFTGQSPRCFGKLSTALRREGADEVRRGRPWGLPLEDRVDADAPYRGVGAAGRCAYGALTPRGVKTFRTPGWRTRQPVAG